MPLYEVEEMENWAEHIEAETPLAAAETYGGMYHGDTVVVTPTPGYQDHPRQMFDVHDSDGELIDNYLVQEIADKRSDPQKEG
jgi:hypothetical protein